MINFFIKKSSSINSCLKVFIIRNNLIKNFIKKNCLLIIKTDFRFKT